MFFGKTLSTVCIRCHQQCRAFGINTWASQPPYRNACRTFYCSHCTPANTFSMSFLHVGRTSIYVLHTIPVQSFLSY